MKEITSFLELSSTFISLFDVVSEGLVRGGRLILVSGFVGHIAK